MRSKRLEFRPVTRAHLAALATGRDALARALGLELPAGWPTFPEAFSPQFFLELPPAPLHWSGYLFLGERSLVGNGGFKGPPNEQGEVELGYEIAPAFRRQGFATEATLALVTAAFSVPGVTSVCAHTLANDQASAGVLAKAGMHRAGRSSDPEVGEVWRWVTTPR